MTLYIWKWNRQGLDMCEEAFIFLDHGFSENLEDVQIHRGKSQSKMQFGLWSSPNTSIDEHCKPPVATLR